MKLRIITIPALLSFALAGAAPGSAAIAPRNLAVVPHAATTLTVPQALTTVETQASFPLLGTAGPDATPSVVGSYIAAVLNISGVPCFDCVNGHTKGTFGSGYPLGYVNTNISAMGILLEWFDVSDTAKCTVTVTLTLAGKTLKTGSGSFTPTVGSIENSQLQVTRSSTWHGLASTTGKVVCGATSLVEKGSFYFK